MKLKHSLLAIALAVFGTSNVYAATHVETGDAGETLATAQALGAGTGSITGTLSGGADLFGFNWGGGAFYVNTQGTIWDTQLFLFNSSGAGVWGNDDGLPGLGSYISDAALASGYYYLAISGYNYDPVTASGLMFQSSPFSPVYGPNHPGETLTGWSGAEFENGTYSINFRSATGEQVETGGSVPEPASIVLLASGLLGFGFSRRKATQV